MYSPCNACLLACCHDCVKTLGPCTVAQSDEMVIDAKKRVRAAIRTHMEAPLRLLKEFESFVGLMNGEEEAKVHRRTLPVDVKR